MPPHTLVLDGFNDDDLTVLHGLCRVNLTLIECSSLVELMHRKKSDDLIASIYMGELLTI